MFDFKNPFDTADEIAALNQQVEELTACDPEAMEATLDWETADWEQITHNHAEKAAKKSNAKKINKRKKIKRRICVATERWAFLAIGLSALGLAVRDMEKLAITLGVIALVFGLTAAFGAGKYREM